MISTSHLHPMLVHFPIALLLIGFVADVVYAFNKKEPCLSKFGFYLLIAGTLAALVALFSGALFTSEMSGSAGEIKETHEMFAWITVGAALVTSVLRIIMQIRKPESSGLTWTAFALYALTAILVIITGFYGGTLVYNYMMPL